MKSISLWALCLLTTWCYAQSFTSQILSGANGGTRGSIRRSGSKSHKVGIAFIRDEGEHLRVKSTLAPTSSRQTQRTESNMASNSENHKSNRPFSSTVPIVLVGFRGAGNELERLADSLIENYHGATPQLSAAGIELNIEEGAQMTFEELNFIAQEEESFDEEIDNSSMGSVISIVGKDDKGIWTLTPDDLRLMFSDKNNISPKDVIVIDFAQPLICEDEGFYKSMLKSKMLDALEYLKNEAKCLVIYVNVDADAGRMAPIPREMKQSNLEETLILLSHYEVAIRDEGLDPLAVTAIGSIASSEVVKVEEAASEQAMELQAKRWEGVELELLRLVAHANLPKAEVGSDLVAKTMGKNTFFLSLSFDHVSKTAPYIEEMCKDVDAIELRVDLLANNSDRHNVLYQLQILRHMCRPHAIRAPALPCGSGVVDDALPIVYTVRTAHQAGRHPDDEDGIKRMFELLKLGLRAGVEVLDIESAWDPLLTAELLDHAETVYPSTMILGSHHVVGQEVSIPEAVDLFKNCALDGRAHGAKVVLSLEEGHEERATMAFDAAEIASMKLKQEGKPVIPNISLVLGVVGQQSRVVNPNFTPVTHESLPMKAAPGQLSAKELMAMRVEQGIIKPLRYAILGHNIAYSVSPQMQGSAFEAAGLPHKYGRADVEDVKEFVQGELFTSNDFGGASITIPHKQVIMPYVDELSEAAKEIGAVNTLFAKYDNNHPDVQHRKIYGDNTDWLGIFRPLKRKLDAASSCFSQAGKMAKGAVLIIGGGGTARAAAFAAKHLGLDRIYFNRTPSKAQDLADAFGGIVVENLDKNGERSLGKYLSSSECQLQIKAVISTLPVAVGFQLPIWMINDENKPLVVLDVNYKPYHTPLLDQCDGVGIETIRGSEMLWEQGVEQFELWTGRLAPYKVMKDAVLQNCLPKEES